MTARTMSWLAMPVLVVLGAACGGGSAQVQVTPPTASVEATVDVGGAAGGLLVGGSAANFGTADLTTGFVPDPHDVATVSGGDLDASTLGLGAGCIGWLTRQPDHILRWTGDTQLLRFYVTSDAGEDTTLVINGADGTYHCNDDSNGGRNPMVDVAPAVAGQYDIWVGSYQHGTQAHATLHITELEGNHP